MSDVIERELRVMARAFAYTAPASPELADMEDSDRRNRSFTATALVAVAAVSIAVLGIVTAFFVGSLGQSEPSTDPTPADPDGWIVHVFFDGSFEVPNAAAVTALEERSEVADVYIVSKRQAYEEALVLFADDQAMLDVLAENPMLLPSRVSVRTATQAEADTLVGFAEHLAGVTHVEDPFYGQITAPSAPDGGPQAMSADSRFLSEPAEQGPIMVFFASEPTDERRDHTLAILAGGDDAGGWAGSETSEGQTRRLRDIIADDDEALDLLAEYPQIAMPYIFFDPATPGVDNQPILERLWLSTDYSAFYTVTGRHDIANIFHPTEMKLPDAAARLQAWWRANLFAELRPQCCGGPDAYDSLRLRDAAIARGEETHLSYWRGVANEACNRASDATTHSMSEDHQAIRREVCPELIPWREQP